MAEFDGRSEDYLARLLSEAPPLTPEQAALIVRTFGRAPSTTEPLPEQKQGDDGRAAA
jgi:hypothetical protein